MTSFNLSVTLVFLSMLSFLSLTTDAADPIELFNVCKNTTYAQNSFYSSNINSLLSSLSSNATRNLEFYNTTVGQNTPNPVYGLYLCRGDVTADMCRRCVVNATDELVGKCKREKVAIIWYDECMVRYSNESIFSTVATTPRFALLNTQNITEQERFNRLVNTTMTELAREASNCSVGVKKFGVKEVRFSDFQNLYSLVQCTPDLSSTDCNSCLQAAVNRLPWCCDGKQGGRVIFPSCNVRYELYAFYHTETPTPTPLAALPPPPAGKSKISTRTIIAIVVPIAASVVLLVLAFCLLIRRARKKSDAEKEKKSKEFDRVQTQQAAKEIAKEVTAAESLQFDFVTIETATKKFSNENKLGEGGFGEVFKGILPNGHEIAVKRLWKRSGEDVKLFKNEVILAATLQHKNLARLLGFCLEGKDKMLIYEYVSNKSLDNFLFDPKENGRLDWSGRYKIIGGIARGIQYLHKNSKYKIIHRDLKPSSILLDENMNPKISDFGMARILEVDQNQGEASKIIGTYGYMSPEYAMYGEFSEKSDIYCFGVLVLEIISSKKNSNFESEGAEDLMSTAWVHWREGRPLELVDPALGDSYSREEATRCIQIGLLCAQKDPADRPTMTAIVHTLNSSSLTLGTPAQPAFFVRPQPDPNTPAGDVASNQSTSMSMPWSVNDVSVTEPHPR